MDKIITEWCERLKKYALFQQEKNNKSHIELIDKLFRRIDDRIKEAMNDSDLSKYIGDEEYSINVDNIPLNVFPNVYTQEAGDNALNVIIQSHFEDLDVLDYYNIQKEKRRINKINISTLFNNGAIAKVSFEV